MFCWLEFARVSTPFCRSFEPRLPIANLRFMFDYHVPFLPCCPKTTTKVPKFSTC